MTPRKIKRNLIKIASDEIPKTPTTSSEIIAAYAKEKIKECYGMTKQDGKDPDKLKSKLFFKYAYESKAFSYCIFASDNIISAIEKHIPVERRKYNGCDIQSMSLWNFQSASNSVHRILRRSEYPLIDFLFMHHVYHVYTISFVDNSVFAYFNVAKI